ncbi:MAG: hypothetical protein IKZ92_00080 [Muribaculaceae bacterium]|nr:hypothetical protein [Muribaculaceae bacterium]
MQQLSPAVLQRTMRVLERYGSRESFLTTLNPSEQLKAGRNPERAILSEDAPTLAIMRHAYGDGFPATWLLPQILDLVVYSNSKGTLSDRQAEFLAEVIANEYGFLKASELLLFFYQFKTGKYGHFYGSVDPMRITIALDEFCDERERVLECHEREQEKIREAQEPKLPSISPEEWCRQVGLPECHSATEVWMMQNRILNIIEGLAWIINMFYKVVCAL